MSEPKVTLAMMDEALLVLHVLADDRLDGWPDMGTRIQAIRRTLTAVEAWKSLLSTLLEHVSFADNEPTLMQLTLESIRDFDPNQAE